MGKKVEAAIAGTGRRFIGGFGTKRKGGGWRYPTNGNREMARRRRQIADGSLRPENGLAAE